MSTIFEKIIARELPAEILYEDDAVISILDINPNNLGHAIVISKLPTRNIFDTAEEKLGKMIAVAKLVAKAQKEALGCDGVNLVMNNEPAAGQEVFHSHLHVIPRYENDQVFAPSKHCQYQAGELANYATKIKAAL